MAGRINVIASAFVALIVGTGLSSVSRAQDCPRGDLDKAYCDRDGDLVADTPSDSKQLVESFDADFCLYARRRPGGLFQGLGWVHQAHGKSHRQEGRLLPGTVERSRD